MLKVGTTFAHVFIMGFVLCFCWLLAGCLVPPPIDEGILRPNQPPRVLLENLTPDPSDGPKTLSVSCAENLFVASVTDSDPADTIYSRIFVDYFKIERPWEIEVRETLPLDIHIEEPRVLSFFIDGNDERFGIDETRFQVPHTVELVVSDRPFYRDSRAPEGRAPTEDGLVDAIVWVINLTDAVDPKCPSQGDF